MAGRYKQLGIVIANVKPAKIVEIGTWNGDRAVEMATEALKYVPEVTYDGFDLFESATPETDSEENNVKVPSTLEDVSKKLNDFAAAVEKDGKKFAFSLTQCNTRDLTNPITGDFAFIDGGHSLETIRHDVELTRGVQVVVLDDYYTKDGDGKCPDLEKFGANCVFGSDWKILSEKDPVKDGGFVQMLVRGWQPKVNLIVKTKNCVPHEEILKNIKYTQTKGLKQIVECKPHELRAIFVSAGPSYKKYLREIREWTENRDARVVCVKHSHDFLVANGIMPWACVLLDPRSHVKEFIENPHQDVIYFTASMVDKTTIDRLVEFSANVWVYHPKVGAGEEELIKAQSFLVPGGSTAATRGLVLLSALGFRKFTLYGYDSCYRTKPDMDQKNDAGQQKNFHVNVSGRNFWSDGELIAQAQDFERLIREWHMVDVEVYGDGMVKHLNDFIKGFKPRFCDVFPETRL